MRVNSNLVLKYMCIFGQEKLMFIFKVKQTNVQGGRGCRLAATFDLAAFSGFYDRHSKVICQSFENRNEHAHNANIT